MDGDGDCDGDEEGRMLSNYTLEEAVGAVGFGKFQWLLLAYAGLGSFAEAMEMMILSFVGSAVKSQWDLSSSQESLLSSVVFAGMLCGAYSWGLISDRYGRRKSILGSILLTCGAGLLSSFSPNYVWLVSLRCMVGIGLGGGHVFLAWFLEFVPASNRGKWMVAYSTFWTFGTIFEAILAWIVMPRLSWRWLLAFSSLPSIALLLAYHLAPESPRFLCTKRRFFDAHTILRNMARLNQAKLPTGMLVSYITTEHEGSSSSSSHKPLLSSSIKTVSSLKSTFSSFFMLFSSKLIQTTLLLWVLYFANAFLYYGIILITSKLSDEQGKSLSASTSLALENRKDDSLYKDVFITSLAELPGILISAILVDRVGRKLSMIFMLVLASIFLWPLVSQHTAILTTSFLFGARMFAAATFIVACIYCPELYPTSVRSTGSGVASAVGRIGGMICPLVAVGMVTAHHVEEAIVLFQVVIGISVVGLVFFPFETKGCELSDSL